MLHHLALPACLAIAVLIGCEPATAADEHQAAAGRGASVPWTTHEAEDMMVTGGVVLGPRREACARDEEQPSSPTRSRC